MKVGRALVWAQKGSMGRGRRGCTKVYGSVWARHVPGMAHVRRVVDGRAADVPLDVAAAHREELDLAGVALTHPLAVPAKAAPQGVVARRPHLALGEAVQQLEPRAERRRRRRCPRRLDACGRHCTKVTTRTGSVTSRPVREASAPRTTREQTQGEGEIAETDEIEDK